MSAAAKKASITLPAQLERELKKIAKKEHRSLSGVIQEASRLFINIKKMEALQNKLSLKAYEIGVVTEDDVVEMIKKSRK